jgi:ABC-2 type transport system permease protein
MRDNGTLTLSYLFSQHNEHRIPFPRLISLANAALFHWDRRVEMYLIALLLVFAAAVLFLFTRTYWHDRRAPLFFIPIIWTLLSWRQFANLLTGFQTSMGLMVAGTVLAFYLLGKARGAGFRIWCAAAVAFVAAFSYGASLALWPIGLIQLLLRQAYAVPSEKPRRIAIGIWTIAGVLTGVLYFHGYQLVKAPWPGGFRYVLQHPILASEFSAILAGSPLSFNLPTARSMGVALSVMAAYAVYALVRLPRARLISAGPLLSLILLMPFWAATLCLGRMGVGLGQGLASRYTSVTALGLVAVYALLIGLALAAPRRDLLACGGMLVLLAIGVLTGLSDGLDDPEWVRFDKIIHMAEYALPHADLVYRFNKI